MMPDATSMQQRIQDIKIRAKRLGIKIGELAIMAGHKPAVGYRVIGKTKYASDDQAERFITDVEKTLEEKEETTDVPVTVRLNAKLIREIEAQARTSIEDYIIRGL